MASTNKTTHYELSQFVGSDKPAWLGDYNSDMSKIDTGINTAQSTATGADGKADANTIAIGTLANLETTVKTDLVSAVNEVNTTAGTAQGTANNAYTLANTANTNLNNFIGQFSFTTTHYTATTPNSRSITNNASFVSDASSDLAISVDSSSAMFKCYGRQNVTVSNAGNVTITLPNAGIVTDTPYEIMGVGSAVNGDGTKILEVQPVSIKVSNGKIEISYYGNRTGLWYVWCTPSLYFNEDFGD